MNPIIRSILAVMAGWVTFVVLIVIIEGINSRIYQVDDSWQQETDPVLRHEAVVKMMEELPDGAFAIVLLGYFIGTFAGAALAAWIAGRFHVLHAGIIGVLSLLGTALNMAMLPHPVWMVVIGQLQPVPVSLLAGWLVTPHKKEHA